MRVAGQMARHKVLPRSSTEHLASKSAFPELFNELMGNGKRWVDAELALVKAEAGVLLRGYMSGLVVALLSFAALISAIVILAQACVVALKPYLDSQILAGVIVGLILLGVAMLLAFTARYLLIRKTQPTGMIFRWLAGDVKERRSK
jgi:hypothetical protein